MAQVSRPLQITLLALVLFALAWLTLLHHPGSSSTASSGSSAAASAHTGAPRAARTLHPTRTLPAVRTSHAASRSAAVSAAASRSAVHAAPSGDPTRGDSRSVRHGAAPAGAHRATAGSSAPTATTLRAHAHSSLAPPHAQIAPVHAHAAPTHARTVPAHSRTATGSTGSSHTRAGTPTRAHPTQGGSAAPAQSQSSTPPLQAAVAAELRQGKVVLLLFWNPHASDDVAVHGQLQAVAHKLAGRVALHSAAASQVGDFGSITRDIQIYQTPTLLIVNPHRQVTTLTGYTEAFAVEQAIAEARG